MSGRPQGRNGDGTVAVAWIGRDPICAASLVGSTHPCRPSDQPDPEPIAARATGDLVVA